MTITLSPVSMWGVNVGLCFPRMIFATSVASLPRTMPSASTMNHLCSMSEGRAENVLIPEIGLMRVQRLTGADCNPGLGRHSRRFRTVCKGRRLKGESQSAQRVTQREMKGKTSNRSLVIGSWLLAYQLRPTTNDRLLAFKLPQERPLLHRLPNRGMHRLHSPSRGRPQLVLHLHRLHRRNSLPRLDLIAWLHVNSDHQPRHRRPHRLRSSGPGGRRREVANGARPLVQRLDRIPSPVDSQQVRPTLPIAPSRDPVHGIADSDEPHGRAFHIAEPRVFGRPAVDGGLIPIDGHLDPPPRDLHDVFHAVAGTSSHTVSTCAVCGNMSNAVSLAMVHPGSRERSRASVAGSQLT